MDIGTILVTTDMSETSKKAFGPAAELAKKFDARLAVVYVEEDKLPPLVVEYTAVGLDEILREQTLRDRKRLGELVQEQWGDLEVSKTVAVGTPHVEILRVAEECGADLIVMATHGRGFISHAILGSTTERVLRRSPCPVFVVRDTENT